MERSALASIINLYTKNDVISSSVNIMNIIKPNICKTFETRSLDY